MKEISYKDMKFNPFHLIGDEWMLVTAGDENSCNMCSHLQRKLFEEDGIYHPLWMALQDDAELMAVVRSRQLHIYRNDKKVLVLAGKAAPKVIREDRICELLPI